MSTETLRHVCGKGWAERCSTAKKKKCNCSCGGHNHGRGQIQYDLPFSPVDKPVNYGNKFEFPGLAGTLSRCGVKAVLKNGKWVVILTELPDNPGTSVTNAVERIATKVYWDMLSGHPQDVIWIEHYPHQGEAETFDLVTLHWSEQAREYFGPSWKRIVKEDINGLSEKN